MLGTPLDRRVRRTLGVSIGDDLTLSLVDTPTVYFPANVAQPQADNGLLDGSPRTSRSVWRLAWAPMALELAACDRIEVPDDTTYELISAPRKVNNGRRVVGYSAPMLPVSILYPRSAELKTQGGGETVATVECAVYSERESNTARGSYEDTFCELPSSAWQHIRDQHNLELHFGDGSVWRLSEATLAPELPYVNASIRKAR
jgi:hypothetical protein